MPSIPYPFPPPVPFCGITVAPWPHGPMAPWPHGPMAPWPIHAHPHDPRHRRTQSTQVISASTLRSRHFSCEVEEWAWKPRSISSRRKKMMCGRLKPCGPDRDPTGTRPGHRGHLGTYYCSHGEDSGQTTYQLVLDFLQPPYVDHTVTSGLKKMCKTLFKIAG